MKDNLEWPVSTTYVLNLSGKNSGQSHFALIVCFVYVYMFCFFCNVLIMCLLMAVSAAQGGVGKKMSGV